jgi:hypothetical protein
MLEPFIGVKMNLISVTNLVKDENGNWKIQVFWNVTHCQWASSFHRLEG